ncbi:MAG: hypothetical protein WCS62_05755 [Bacilli bacterium]
MLDYINHKPDGKILILRHDVDRYITQVPAIIDVEASLDIRASYYVRSIPSVCSHQLLNVIVDNGHELGYHYENLSLTAKVNPNIEYQALVDKAYGDFKNSLEFFRGYYPVKTITMHGDSLSKYNNLDLWKHHDYRELGIICEPYLDMDFSHMGYLTDVGRAWNKASVNRRDVTKGISIYVQSSMDLKSKVSSGEVPDCIMMNMHPEHWTDSSIRWIQLYAVRLVKNNLKRVLLK